VVIAETREYLWQDQLDRVAPPMVLEAEKD
jgi:hypothetical protein